MFWGKQKDHVFSSNFGVYVKYENKTYGVYLTDGQTVMFLCSNENKEQAVLMAMACSYLPVYLKPIVNEHVKHLSIEQRLELKALVARDDKTILKIGEYKK